MQCQLFLHVQNRLTTQLKWLKKLLKKQHVRLKMQHVRLKKQHVRLAKLFVQLKRQLTKLLLKQSPSKLSLFRIAKCIGKAV